VYQHIVTTLLQRAGVEPNGKNPFDPQIKDSRFYRAALLHGSIGLGDAYLDEWWNCADLSGCMLRIIQSGIHLRVPRVDLMLRKCRFALIDAQSRKRSRKVAEVHYDEDPQIFEIILGATNSYTCARWRGATTLDAAQEQKMDLLSRKAQLKSGGTVLEPVY
jgi:cyclopropane-fatty-acyl-phospholipid synthase